MPVLKQVDHPRMKIRVNRPSLILAFGSRFFDSFGLPFFTDCALRSLFALQGFELYERRLQLA